MDHIHFLYCWCPVGTDWQNVRLHTIDHHGPDGVDAMCREHQEITVQLTCPRSLHWQAIVNGSWSDPSGAFYPGHCWHNTSWSLLRSRTMSFWIVVHEVYSLQQWLVYFFILLIVVLYSTNIVVFQLSLSLSLSQTGSYRWSSFCTVLTWLFSNTLSPSLANLFLLLLLRVLC